MSDLHEQIKRNLELRKVQAAVGGDTALQDMRLYELFTAFLAEVEEKDAELSQARAMREFVEGMEVQEKERMGEYLGYGERPYERPTGVENEIRANREMAVRYANEEWRNLKSQSLALYPKREE